MNIINIKDTENKLYYVGGVVRDELLGIKSFDIDMVYEGDAIELAVTIPPTPLYKGGKTASIKKNGEKNVPQEFEILQINEPFGTVRVKIDGRDVDIASTRAEIYEKKGHLPTITKIGCSLNEDAARRDFTINALYKSVSTGEIIDPTGGLEDLKNKKIKVLHDKSFIDDPTRILRALKFSVRFGFELDEYTKKLQDEYLNNINYDICYKRIKKELIETFNLNSQKAFERFINDRIYKLVTELDVRLPQVNIEELINKYMGFFASLRMTDKSKNLNNKSPQNDNLWLVYVGTLGDLSRLPLNRNEQKILDDFNAIGSLHNDFEIYKAFEKVQPETLLLYAIMKDKNSAVRYLEKLRDIKIEINGDDLTAIGLKPSKKFSEIFDYVLRKKLENPNLTKEDELKLVRDII